MHQHRLRRVVHAVVSAAICASTAITVLAQTPADNTKVNSQDRVKGEVTADQQKENAGDREIAKKIRQSLINDKGLSTYAHNVKVVVQGGQVTLKGPVRSEDEKKVVEAKAIEVAGAGHVKNEISVAPSTTAKPKG